MADENCWRTNSFRQSIVAKIDEAIRTSGMTTARNSLEMENHVFQKAKTKEEYLGFVARLILHVREIKTKQGGGMAGPGPGQGGPGMPDPINALQNLASQGTRNPLMNMGPQPGQMAGQQQATATNLLQTLNRGPGQQMMMGNMQGNMSGGMSMQTGQDLEQNVEDRYDTSESSSDMSNEDDDDDDDDDSIDEKSINENEDNKESDIIDHNESSDTFPKNELSTPQEDIPGTSSSYVSGVAQGNNEETPPPKKKRKRRIVAVQMVSETIRSKARMARMLQMKNSIKQTYYKEKLKLMQRDIEAKERIAAALENMTFHS